jgi:glycine betaine/proline transport system permease protein
MATVTATVARARGWRPNRLTISAAIVAAWIILWSILRGRDTLSLSTSDTTPLHDRFTALRDYVDNHRYSSAFFTDFVNVIRNAVDQITIFLQNLISQPSFDRPVPLIGWLGVVALATLAAFAFANWRMALLTAAGFVTFGLLGLWQESMDTLAITITAVGLSLLFGIPLGVWVGLSRRIERLATPVLDVMQAMPTFVYLAPLSLIFLIGPAAAVITTLIYAMPPVIRLTALGIREVSEASLEASRSLGATRWQQLRSVRLPLAKRTIIVGVNQTTMAALSMVTIAALIDSPGLGQTVLRALQSTDVGTAFQGGLALVVMAIVLDRVTTAASVRAEARYRAHSRPATPAVRRWSLVALGGLTAVALYLAYTYYWAAVFPGEDTIGVIGRPIANGVGSASNWILVHLFTVTSSIKDAFSYGLINPFQELLADSPWYLICAVVLGLTWTVAGARALIVATICLGLLVGTGLWEESMVTLTSVLVAVLITLVIGVVGGVLIARNRRADLLLRPVLDAAQAMPSFVYLPPAVGLFAPSRFTAIVAAVIFAVPVVVKVVADGIAGVPPTAVEAATASGSSNWQIITKVQLPMSRAALALAANQGLIYVLSMVVVGALVGGGALGYLVVAGFSQSDLWGKGLAAGIAIVVLCILLDRVTQAATRRAQAADTAHRYVAGRVVAPRDESPQTAEMARTAT